MTSPTGRPEFFILEAGEHLERIALLVRQPEPDPDDLLRFTRALRGSALMAGPPGYAVTAGALEDLAQRYHARRFDWTADLAGLVGDAVEQCRELLRRVRQWSPEEITTCRRIADTLVPAEFEDGVVPIESLAPDVEAPVVTIESLAPEPGDGPEDGIVPIESLLYDESPRAEIASLPLSSFERSFSTYFRLVQGVPIEEAAVTLQGEAGKPPERELEPEAVPIQRLLYRGQRALQRARLVREELAAERRGQAEAEVLDSLVDELLDLVPLALEHD